MGERYKSVRTTVAIILVIAVMLGFAYDLFGIQIKNNEYWQPSSIMVISNVSPYKKNIYDLSKYWNMNQEYSNANIEELKIINENIKDAKLVSINYVNGTAKFESKINDLVFTVPFKYLNDETIVSDEMKLNNLFRNISAINA